MSVQASGIVVWRRSVDQTGEMELLVIHRPRYDDWSFAKGKLDPGETDEECADRELFEETGFVVERTHELASVSYVDHKGRPKVVRYWLGELREGTFVANDEVDRIEWLTPAEARATISYDHDRPLVDEALGILRQ